VLPSRVGGILMADSVESPHLATYVMDLISAGGQVMLAERDPSPEEIGRRPVDLGQSLIVRVIRGAQAYSFWEQPAKIQPGDKLIVLHSRAAAPGA
jgi:voltage-gated potassium channel